MRLESLKDALRRPEAYTHRVDTVELEETHASLVFLAGSRAYKIKKPVDLGFLDYSTLDKRQHFCREELRLNRRLAPDVYLEVVPVVGEPPRFADPRRQEPHAGEPLEWTVVMRRLDPKHHLRRRLAEDRLPPGSIERIARRLKTFHDEAHRGDKVDEHARFSTVRTNALDNFQQRRDDALQIISESTLEAIEAATRARLEEARPIIEARHREGRARDTHGDLRLEHIYIDDSDDLHIIDCIEFCDAFRYADPLLDMAFLAMDLDIRGHHQRCQKLWHAYLDGDSPTLRPLIDLYCSYRSAVRAKVHGVKAGDDEVDERARKKARQLARAHWYYAWWKASPPGEGPALLLLGGLPASGKSTRARKLKERGAVDVVLDSDVIRKQLADEAGRQDEDQDWESGIYTPEWSRRTYGAMRDQARKALLDGQRVAVAASFRNDRWRCQFVDLARSLGLPVRFFECTIDDDLARQRLQGRQDDPSDANWTIYRSIKERWEAPSKPIAPIHRRLSPTEDPGDQWDRS